MPLQTITTPIGDATLLGRDPDGTRILCMHTKKVEVDGKTKSSTYAKWWLWDGTHITDEYKEDK